MCRIIEMCVVQVVSQLMPAKMYAKLNICGTDHAPMLAHIDPDQIPQELGGTYNFELEDVLPGKMRYRELDYQRPTAAAVGGA